MLWATLTLLQHPQLLPVLSYDHSFLTSSTVETSSHWKEPKLLTNYSSHWKQLSLELCPDHTPQTRFANHLFLLAQRELGLPNATERKTYNEFFNGTFHGTNLYMANNSNFTALYLRIWKGGNNQIANWVRHVTKQVGGVGSALELRSSLDIVEKHNRVPCIVTAVRDPISHFLSGYNEVEHRFVHRRQGFRNNNSASLVMKRLEFPNRKVGSKERFTSFVEDLLKGDDVWVKNEEFLHVFPMARVLVPISDSQLKLSGYLPTISNLLTEWPRFLRNTCPDMPDALVNVTSPEPYVHASSADLLGTYQAARDAWNEGGPVARALCILHAMDYACWSNLPKEIPLVCQEVYETIKLPQQGTIS